MNKNEQTVQTVLAGLRDCEAPPGMERRILQAVEERTSVHATSRGSGLTPLWALTLAASHGTRSRAWLAASVAVIAVFITVGVLQLRERVSIRSSALPVQSSSLSHATSEGVSHATRPHSTNPFAGHPVAATKTRMLTRKVQPARRPDSTGLAEMRAPSHPAPEAPLTQQEKLLLRIAHAGDPQQVAMLNPVIRARQDADSQAEFQKFVEQSIKEDRE